MNNDEQISSSSGPLPGVARRWRTAAAVAGTLAVAALLAAACGGSQAPASSSRPSQNLAVELDSFASCMRSHGVSGFYFHHQSDAPSPPRDGVVVGFHGYYAEFDPSSPAFQAAQKSCKDQPPFTGGLTGTGSGGSHQQFLQALKVVSCLRSHGYPNWPGPISGHVVFPASLDSQSTQFQTVAKTCGLSGVPGS